ncbi:hypothetical protein QVD17_17166 [Tagetes erecta]|uniref:C2H2-type domain-containing protein n=1 Tax=Tagetes erecta TaxID=13708 RepID=A0AAD8KVF2_TARER|nr:hypothetical protein QVD17_17166 [Tagetes erecta]
MMFSSSIYDHSSTSNKTSTSLSEEADTSKVSPVISTKIHHHDHFPPSIAISSISNRIQDHDHINIYPSPQKIKKKRNLPGNPDPDAEVIALSPKTLMATNRFVCEICNKGFQRDQNLQLHRRGHNLPWKLKQRNNKDEIKKRAYVCPEPTCVHHHPSRALGDLTGIKKHFCRKHGEKKWKCDKCSKIYAVQSDWKAHSKTCGTREYRCDCGTLFSRKDSFITHRAFCDALAEETARLSAAAAAASLSTSNNFHPSTITNLTHPPFNFQLTSQNPQTSLFPFTQNLNPSWIPTQPPNPTRIKPESILHHNHHQPSPLIPAISLPFYQEPVQVTFSSTGSHLPSPHLSATALLQKAATVGVATVGDLHVGDHVRSTMSGLDMGLMSTWQKTDHLTRDFLGLTGDQEVDHHGSGVDANVNVRRMLTYAGGIEIPADGFGTSASEAWGNC